MPDTPGMVLYVDDEVGNRVVFEHSLARDFSVKTAASAADALEIMERNDVAVVVTDMRMPTMDGEELLRIVKERWPQAIRIVVTAYADIEPILRAINEGLVARYILKPWVRTELVQVLRWALETWALSRESGEIQRRILETERLTTLGTITGLLVHDLASPATTMDTNLTVLSESLAVLPELRDLVITAAPFADQARLLRELDDIQPIVDELRATASYVRDLVVTLREFNKPPEPSLANTSVDPLRVVRHALAVCQLQAMKLRASLLYDGPSELPAVRIPATALTQVLINLVSNSTQAIAARGTPNGKVSVVARRFGDTLELVVSDDGVGMPEDVLKRIGTPFFTTRAQGTGLGIAQCQRLIGTAGGRLKIESQLGVGTTVTITLPTAA